MSVKVSISPQDTMQETQSDLSTGIAFQWYFLIYPQFGVVSVAFWRICKNSIPVMPSDLSTIMPSDLCKRIFRNYGNSFCGGSRHAVQVICTYRRFRRSPFLRGIYWLCFIRGCYRGVLWYLTGVPDVIIRHIASFRAHRLKVFDVHKAYVISQNAVTMDLTIICAKAN
jgi:hypothetical protein